MSNSDKYLKKIPPTYAIHFLPDEDAARYAEQEEDHSDRMHTRGGVDDDRKSLVVYSEGE